MERMRQVERLTLDWIGPLNIVFRFYLVFLDLNPTVNSVALFLVLSNTQHWISFESRIDHVHDVSTTKRISHLKIAHTERRFRIASERHIANRFSREPFVTEPISLVLMRVFAYYHLFIVCNWWYSPSVCEPTAVNTVYAFLFAMSNDCVQLWSAKLVLFYFVSVLLL